MMSANKPGSIERGYDHCTICLCEIETKIAVASAICSIDDLNKKFNITSGMEPRWYPVTGDKSTS